jgi:hypothetical protein
MIELQLEVVRDVVVELENIDEVIDLKAINQEQDDPDKL